MIASKQGVSVLIKFLIFSLLITSLLNARSNPFFPSEGEVDIPHTSNKSTAVAPLKRATIELPAHARILQKVTIEYKNLDGSVDTKSIELENSVDWHLPIFISQNYSSSSNKSKASKKFKKIVSLKYATYYAFGKTLKIVTKDKVIRNFLLTDPHRIVIDFKRDLSLRSLNIPIENSIFSRVRVGNHRGYYRVVVELDGHYRYTMKPYKNGYIFTLR